MATIFQRISLIVKSNVNELLDRFEAKYAPGV